MSSASALPYQLRPNKAVDRELFLSLLARLSGVLKLETYTYISLGGPFLEDFRLVHSRLGIRNMKCIEAEESVHKRQCFNRPIPSVECIHNTLEGYLDATEFPTPIILWFDYTDPAAVTSQIARFADTVLNVPLFSILRITLNANPGSLGSPPTKTIQTPPNGIKDEADPRPTLGEWRMTKLRDRLGAQFPNGTQPTEMEKTRYGAVLLRALRLAVSNELLSSEERTVSWVLATHYADGQPMVTATLLVLPVQHSLDEVVANWPFHSLPDAPLGLDMPVLSTRERLTLERHGEQTSEMDYDLPLSNLGLDPIATFTKFYSVFPHFSKVDL